QSDVNGEATIEITYFTSGITWSADYLCRAGKDESSVRLEGFVRITNNSGEDYENAHVRLVVGTINLVEKIAQLAQIPMADVKKLDEQIKLEMRAKVLERSIHLAAGEGKDAKEDKEGMKSEKQVVKEGL